MKKIATTIILLAIHSSVQAKTVLKIQEWQEKSGAQVLYVPIKQLPMVDVQVVLKVGSYHDKKNIGLANLAAELIGTTVKGYTRIEFARAIESTGASYQSSAGFTTTTLSFRSLSDEKVLRKVESLMSKALSQTAPTMDDFNQVRSSITQEIINDKSDPGRQGFNKIYSLLFDGHPYSNTQKGTVESLKNISLEQVQNYLKNKYSRNKAVVVIVGDVSRKRAEKLAKKLLSGLPDTKVESIAPIPATRSSLARKAHTVEFPIEQTHIIYAIQGINQKSEYFYPLLVANHIFGGNGFSSRLMQKIRTKEGLAYSAYSGIQPLIGGGLIYINVQTKNKSKGRVVELIDQELQAMKDSKISNSEFVFAKNNLINREASLTSSNKKVLELCTLIALYDLPRNYLNLRTEKIKSITLKEALFAWNHIFSNNNLVKVFVGKK